MDGVVGMARCASSERRWGHNVLFLFFQGGLGICRVSWLTKGLMIHLKYTFVTRSSFLHDLVWGDLYFTPV